MSPQLTLSAGDDTEDLLQCVLDGFNDEELDEIEVERRYAPSRGMANEPVTIMVILTLGPPLISATTKLLEKWMDTHGDHPPKLEIAVHGIPAETATLLGELAKRPEVELTDGPPAV